MAKFHIFESTNKQYYYHLKSSNGEIILSGEGYITHSGCKNGIESVKVNSTNDFRYKRLIAANGQYYFTLTAANGETIGQSEMYWTAQARENGINAVKRDAPIASIVDHTLQSTY